VPELVLVDLDPALGRAEPDPEIQELIEGSGGLNVGVDFLPGSLALDGAAAAGLDATFAADVVWFDALVMNVDRTPRNPNILVWHQRPWLIDHGAAIYVQHAWTDPAAEGARAFPAIRDHVLLAVAGPIAPRTVARDVLDEVAALVPPDWLGDARAGDYADFLEARLQSGFAAEAEEARRGA
jgi:hypothetical protein